VCRMSSLLAEEGRKGEEPNLTMTGKPCPLLYN